MNKNTELIRAVCQRLTFEYEPEKVHDLLGLLHAVINQNDEEIGLQLAFLREKYSLDALCFHPEPQNEPRCDQRQAQQDRRSTD